VFGRKGINQFTGYNPLQMDVPIQFEDYASGDGTAVERDIRILERMAGRGTYSGAAVGPPDVIRLSVIDNHSRVVPLIPVSYQWVPKVNPSPPTWRISGIAWDANPLSDDSGNRIRQKAVVTVTEFTPVLIVQRSATVRAKAKAKPKAKK